MARSRNNALEFSSAGSVIVAATSDTNTTAAANNCDAFGAIQCLQDTTFASSASFVSTNVTGNLNSKTLGAGTVLYGNFTEVKINTGLIQLHKV